MSAGSYLKALRAVGIIEVIGVDAGYYQGDYFAAVIEPGYYDAAEYWEDDKIGLLVIGYGSCSGCDAWESADTANGRLEVLGKNVDSIKWFDDLAAFKAYLAGDGAKLEWYGHEEEWAEFVAKVNTLGEFNEIKPQP